MTKILYGTVVTVKEQYVNGGCPHGHLRNPETCPSCKRDRQEKETV